MHAASKNEKRARESKIAKRRDAPTTVITSNYKESGLEIWRKLHQNNEPHLYSQIEKYYARRAEVCKHRERRESFLRASLSQERVAFPGVCGKASQSRSCGNHCNGRAPLGRTYTKAPARAGSRDDGPAEVMTQEKGHSPRAVIGERQGRIKSTRCPRMA